MLKDAPEDEKLIEDDPIYFDEILGYYKKDKDGNILTLEQSLSRKYTSPEGIGSMTSFEPSKRIYSGKTFENKNKPIDKKPIDQ